MNTLIILVLTDLFLSTLIQELYFSLEPGATLHGYTMTERVEPL